MMTTPRMIAIDMDGTLVHPGGTVTEENQTALRSAREQGARIVIATGRRHSYAMKVLRTVDFHPNDVVLSSNGTVARTIAGELLFRRPMPLDTARWLCTQLGDFRNAFVLTYDLFGEHGEDIQGALVLEELDTLHNSISSWMDANARYIRRVDRIEDSFADEHGNPVAPPIQAMLCGTIDRMARAETLLRANQEDRLELFRTEYPARDLCILDILPRGCSKGSGLELLLESQGLTEQDLMCIGDNWNDVSMLERARWPFLMGNAPPALQQLARERNWTITVNHDEHGVAEAIGALFPAHQPA